MRAEIQGFLRGALAGTLRRVPPSALASAAAFLTSAPTPLNAFTMARETAWDSDAGPPCGECDPWLILGTGVLALDRFG